MLSKVVERIVYHFEESHLLSPFRYGFRRHRLTQHTVIKLADHIRERMDKKQLIGALFIDLRKGFDTVNHTRLLHILPFYDI